MKLTPDLIEGAFQFINKATRDRELDLRDYKIGTIENLGATLDQFDCLDFTDNDIRRVEGFPLLPRLKRLYLSNNRITKIDEQLAECVPNLEGILLINNQISELGDIDPLGKLKHLEMVSLLANPITTKKHYRLYLINRLPALRVLDFKKIKLKEREEAKRLFSGDEGNRLERELGIKSKTFVPGEDSNSNKPGNNSQKRMLSNSEIQSIKSAISKAKTLEEIERLNQMLKSGCIPGNNRGGGGMQQGRNNNRGDHHHNQQQEYDMDTDDRY